MLKHSFQVTVRILDDLARKLARSPESLRWKRNGDRVDE
jgi:hypothetical protein